MNNNILCFILLAFSTLPVQAQDMKPMENQKDFFNKLKSVSATTQSIKANFTEEKFIAALKQPQKSSGVFYYEKENKIRWEQNFPFQYIIMINKDDIRIKENEKEKEVSAAKRMVEKIKELLLMLVSGTYLENKTFAAQYFENNKEYTVVLVPTQKKLKNYFDKIQLNFSKETIHLNDLIFFEHSGDRSTMTFVKQRFNEDINDDVFSKF